MNMSLRSVLCALVLPSMLLIGCKDDSSSNDDMASSNLDMKAGDGSMSATCTSLTTWPSDMLFGAGATDPLTGYDFLTQIYADKANGTLTDTMRVELYHMTGTNPTLPRTVQIPATGTYNTCDDCVLIDLGQDFAANDSGTLYFARGGSLTVTKADRNPVSGSIQVSGSNVHFVEWNFDGNNDKPVANGKCIDVASFNFSTTYDNSEPDGGTD